MNTIFLVFPYIIYSSEKKISQKSQVTAQNVCVKHESGQFHNIIPNENIFFNFS